MTRRWALLAGALALSLSVPQAAAATAEAAAPAAPATPSPAPDAAASAALADLRDDARGGVRVQRDAAGEVAFVSSSDGEAMVPADAASPQGAARENLTEYGEAFGIDGGTSKGVVTQ